MPAYKSAALRDAIEHSFLEWGSAEEFFWKREPPLAPLSYSFGHDR